MTRFNPIVIASLLFVLALLCISGPAKACEEVGALCITQSPAESLSIPQAWTVTEVSHVGDAYVYDLTVEWVGEDMVGFTSVTFERRSGYGSASITIRNLTVTRPDEDDQLLSATLGISGAKLNAVQEVDVDPWSSGEQEGYVRVFADIEGPTNTNVLGDVQGPNYFQSHIHAGDVGGPIVCTMHPLAEAPGAEASVVCTIKLSGDGNLFGDVIMESWDGATDENYPTDQLGHITWVKFQSGVIGAENSKVDIHSDGMIAEVLAREIHANIAGTNNDPGDTDFDSYVALLGTVFADKTTGVDNGHFTGEIRAEELGNTYVEERESDASNITIQGEMLGRIWLQRMDEDDYGITIDSSTPKLLEGATISLGVLNPAEGSSVWASDVEIRADGHGSQINLDIDDADGYPQLASELGGGAVGLVPFLLHREDCFPIHDTIVSPEESNAIVMRHYGPVIWDAGNGQPFEVYRRKAGSSDSWQLQNCFTCELDEENDTIVHVSTTTVETLQRGFQYQVKLRTFNNGGNTENVLRCNLPHLSTANDPEVADDANGLLFRVCDAYFVACPGDADDDGIVEYIDADCVLENWSSTDCMKYGDADRDGVVDGDDLDAVDLYLTFEYCYSESFGLAKTADGFAQMDLDSDPATMSEPMTISQAVQYMGYEDIADFATGFDAMSAPARAAARACLMALISGE